MEYKLDTVKCTVCGIEFTTALELQEHSLATHEKALVVGVQVDVRVDIQKAIKDAEVRSNGVNSISPRSSSNR